MIFNTRETDNLMFSIAEGDNTILEREIGELIPRVKDEALCFASANGNIEAVEKLLDSGADVNCSKGYCAFYAMRNGHVDTVRLLIDRGATRSVLKRRLNKYFFRLPAYILYSSFCNFFGTHTYYRTLLEDYYNETLEKVRLIDRQIDR